MRHPDPELTDRLAAEFVLGTLRGPARRRFTRWIASDPAVARAVHGWEERFAMLGAGLPAVAPGPEVWRAIAGRTGISAAPIPATTRRPARRWAASALAASIALLAVAVWLYWAGPSGAARWQTAAELRAAPRAQLAWRIDFDAGRRELRSSAEHPPPAPPSGAHELWALVPGAAHPVSLGVLPAAGHRVLRLTPAQLGALRNATRLAVSEEPPLGSPTGLPTGRVVLVAPRDPLRFDS